MLKPGVDYVVKSSDQYSLRERQRNQRLEHEPPTADELAQRNLEAARAQEADGSAERARRRLAQRHVGRAEADVGRRHFGGRP